MRTKDGNNSYRIADIHAAASIRKPGYVKAVFAAALERTASRVVLTRHDAARISREYGDGNPVIRRGLPRKPRIMGKSRSGGGGCGPCSKGKSKPATARNMDQWHKAMEIPE